MRKEDSELVRMLIDTLMASGSFTLTSFMRFYNIFVWQCADKREQIDFVARLLMKDAP
jgi:5-carboxymethyl-2-hydroxymuconate isomerase